MRGSSDAWCAAAISAGTDVATASARAERWRAAYVVAVIHEEFGISQSAVSQHLGILRDSGFASARIDGAQRMYMIDTLPMREVDVWLQKFRAPWEQKLEALATEAARGKRNRREAREREA